MKIEFAGSGTAEDVADALTAYAALAAADVKDENEHAALAAAIDAATGVLATVDGDRQATVTIGGEVRGAELTKVYLDITIVPSAAVQEAKAEAGRPSAAEFEAAVE